jgi:hypothetical protein
MPTSVQSEISDLPIAEAAHEVIELERSVPLDGEFEIALGEAFGPDLRGRFDRQEATGAIRLYRLGDVTLDASLMLLLRGRSRISETRYFVSDQEYNDTLIKPLPAQPLDPKQHYIIGSNRAWHDYYHWLVQALPAIDFGLRCGGQRRTMLVVPPLQAWQEESLALLGYEEIPKVTLEVSDTLLLPNAEFSDFLGERMPEMVARTAMSTFRRLSKAVPWTHAAPEEIYVAGAAHQAIENEAELIDLLERQGVQTLLPGELSVAQLIAAFRAARLVIGAHGKPMSNVVFCQGGSFVYELLPRHQLGVTVNRLAQTATVNYWADIFSGEGGGGWRVDLDTVAARLDAIRDRMAMTPRRESAMDFLKRTQAAAPEDGAPPRRARPTHDVAAEELQSAEQAPPRRRGLARLFSRGSG